MGKAIFSTTVSQACLAYKAAVSKDRHQNNDRNLVQTSFRKLEGARWTIQRPAAAFHLQAPPEHLQNTSRAPPGHLQAPPGTSKTPPGTSGAHPCVSISTVSSPYSGLALKVFDTFHKSKSYIILAQLSGFHSSHCQSSRAHSVGISGMFTGVNRTPPRSAHDNG